MYSIITAAFTAIAVHILFWQLNVSNPWWGILWAFVVFAATMVGINLLMKKKVSAVMADMQKIMLQGRDVVQRKVAEFQRRPSGDPKAMMAQLEKMQRAQIEIALAHTNKLEAFTKWVPLLNRQISTTRMQFNYQLKNFKEVDALMPKCLILDPLSASMKLARMHVNNASIEEIEKTFKQISTRLRYNQSALAFALMSWICVKNGDAEKAHQYLVKGCAANENETLKRNRDRLANNKLREFSNANLGDEWYALFLEEPKMRVERRMPRADGRPF
jgi:hypothetical protein